MIFFDKYSFDNMIEITKNTDNFWAKEHYIDNEKFIIFDYSHQIPERFSNEYALEMRGSMFHVTKDNKFIKAVCRPFEKFFNGHEFNYSENLSKFLSKHYGLTITTKNVQTMLDNHQYKNIFDKRDGSVISSFIFNDTLYVKSAASLNNEYVDEAMKLLNKDQSYKDKVEVLTKQGLTVIFEYTSAKTAHKIVVDYDETKLTVLAVRDIESGTYMDIEDIENFFGSEYVVKRYNKFTKDLLNRENTEGLVIEFQNNFRIKFKNEWYLERHRKFDMIRKPKMIWEYYLTDNIDELIDTCDENNIEYLKRYINEFDKLFTSFFHIGKTFYEENKTLDNRYYYGKLRDTIKNDPVSYKVADFYKKGASEKDIHEKISNLLNTPKMMSQYKIQTYLEIID